MPDLPYDPYAAARITPNLVGRQSQISAIIEIVNSVHSSQLIHIVGAGGIGKTRLLTHILSELQNQTDARVAKLLVDLYHAETNTVEGLVDEIAKAIDPDIETFPTYHAARRHWEEMRAQQANTQGQLDAQRDQMLNAFINDMNALAEERPLVFALDTAEKLELQYDALAENLGVAQRQTDTVAWLYGGLNQMKNVVVILAGRPGNGQVGERLKDALGTAHYRSINLQGLTEDEALAYFDAVVKRLEAEDRERVRHILRSLHGILPATRRTIFYCLCDKAADENAMPTVRPILLALAIDLYTMATDDKQLTYFLTSLDVAMQFTQSQRVEIQEWLGKAVIDNITKNLTTTDQLVWALGWLRKGATAAMLAEISGISSHEFDEGWKTLGDLSFVKRRIRDDRYFLHDEMYDILSQHLLGKTVDAARQRVFTNLRAYHSREIERVDTQIDENIIPLAKDPKERANLEALIQLQQEERSLIVDDIYYRLRFNAEQGFQSYFRASESAVSAHDVELGELLRTEMRAFVQATGLGRTQTSIDGLRYADIRADEAVRWIKWLHDASNYPAAIALIDRLQGDLFAELVEPGGLLAQAEINSWHGLLATEIGLDQQGIGLIEGAISTLLPRQNTQRWIGILARAYNNLGYCYFGIGRAHRSIDAYKQAIPLWRALKMDNELANTLNNLAFELAGIGDFENAQSLVRDGLRLRERQGLARPVGLSLNTMAEINIKAFASEIAIEQAVAAHKLFSDLGYTRGEGLALRALAEATRRSSVSPTNQQLHRTVALLEASERHALAALTIFQGPVQELRREVWCWIEVGCIYRDWYRWRKFAKPDELSPQERENKREHLTLDLLFAKSQQGFVAAIEKTPDDSISYKLEAMISWIWLLYYHHLGADQIGFAWKTCTEIRDLAERIEKLIADRFGQEREILNQAQIDRTDLLILLGEWEAFLGESELRLFRQDRNEMALHQAAKHCSLALTAYERYSPHIIRQSRRTRTRFYELLKRMSSETLSNFYAIVAEVEAQLGFTETIMSQFLIEQFGPAESHIVIEL